jgi:hypothetical protein
MWAWLKSLFTKPTYTITVSYDTQFGNGDDKVWNGIKTITKQTWKELHFVTTDKKKVQIRSNAGLNYRIEEE